LFVNVRSGKRRPKWIVVAGGLLLSCSVLVTVAAPAPAHAAGPAETIVDLYPEPAATTFKATKLVLQLLGYWRDSDPYERMLSGLFDQIAEITMRLEAFNSRLSEAEHRILAEENQDRLQNLRELERSLKRLALRLQQRPSDVNQRQQIALDAQLLAETLLVERDLWLWSDVNTMGGGMLPPVLKPYPTFELYIATLAAWLTAIDLEASGDALLIREKYGPELRKHVDFLMTRASFDDLVDEPESLPEEVMKAVSCELVPQHTHAKDGVCTFSKVCADRLARKRRDVGELVLQADDGPTALCNFPEALNQSIQGESEIEEAYGVLAMNQMAELLMDLANRGGASQFIGVFDATPVTDPTWIYTIAPNGDLQWYGHAGGSMQGRSDWEGPKVVGTGWNTFKAVLPAGGPQFYTVSANGDLHWHQHKGWQSGRFGWSERTLVGIGWEIFSRIIPAGDGVLYGMKPDGTLHWYRHTGVRTGVNVWMGPVQVGSGWQHYKHIFSTGNGILYGVTQDGRLQWHHHLGFMNGEISWEPWAEVNTGWQGFRRIFSPGDGIIYAVRDDGQLLWYRHHRFDTGGGSSSFEGPVVVGSGWRQFNQIIPMMPMAFVEPK
jgi:hypothetical protein